MKKGAQVKLMIIKFSSFILLILHLIGNTYSSSCPDGMYQVRGHDRKAHHRDGHYVQATKVSSYCKHYRNDGPLKLKFRQRMPQGWSQKKEKFKKCSRKKQNKIAKALSELPPILTNVGHLKIHCAVRSVYPKNPATVAPEAKIIVLYDSVLAKNMKRIIAHELAHILYDRLSDEEKEELYKVSLWEDDKKKFSPKRKKFSELDGANDPDEDFANNIEHYLFENKNFQNKFPKIHQWIKKLMGGQR